MDRANHELQEIVLHAYKRSKKPGCIPFVFGVPFTMASIFCLIATIKAGPVWLIALLLFAFVAYAFGWAMWVEYIRTMIAIKKGKYTRIPVVCTEKSFGESYRYHDSGDEEEYTAWTFRGETKEYSLTEWGVVEWIHLNEEYLLIFLGSTDRIDMIYDQNAKKVVYSRS